MVVLTIWTWYEHTGNMQMAAIKNTHHLNRWRHEVSQSTDTLFLRVQAFKLVDALEKKHAQADRISGRVQTLLTSTVVFSIAVFMLISVEYLRKQNSNKLQDRLDDRE